MTKDQKPTSKPEPKRPVGPNFVKPTFVKPNLGGGFNRNQKFPMPTIPRGVR